MVCVTSQFEMFYFFKKWIDWLSPDMASESAQTSFKPWAVGRPSPGQPARRAFLDGEPRRAACFRAQGSVLPATAAGASLLHPDCAESSVTLTTATLLSEPPQAELARLTLALRP